MPDKWSQFAVKKSDPWAQYSTPAPQGQTSAQANDKLFGSAPVDTHASMYARPTGPLQGPINWLEDLQGDVRNGTGLTLPGRVLQFLGAKGTSSGVPESVGNLMPGGGTVQGIAKVAQAPLLGLQGHPVLGANRALEGVGQVAAPAIAASNPEFLAAAAPMAAAGTAGEAGLKSLGVSPEWSEFLTNAAMMFGGGKKAFKTLSDTQRAGKLSLAGATPAQGEAMVGPAEKTMQTLLGAARTMGGNIKTVGDGLRVIQTAKDNLNSQWGNSIGPYANAPGPITPQGTFPVADAILKLKDKIPATTAEGRAERAYIDQKAAEFQNPVTFGDLDKERMRANSRLHAFEKKGDSAQYAAVGSNVGTAVDKAIADSIRDTIYPAVDKLAGLPDGYSRSIKDQVGNLMQLEDGLTQAGKDVHAKTARAQAASPFDRARMGTTIGSGGGLRGWVSNVKGAMIPPNPEGKANSAVSAAFNPDHPTAWPLIMGIPIKTILTGDYNNQ